MYMHWYLVLVLVLVLGINDQCQAVKGRFMYVHHVMCRHRYNYSLTCISNVYGRENVKSF